MKDKQFAEDEHAWSTFSDTDSLEYFHNRQAEYDRQKEKRVVALREALEGGFMEELTTVEGEVFKLVYLEGLDKVTISHKLNRSYESIRKAEFRAVSKLRSFLEVDRTKDPNEG